MSNAEEIWKDIPNYEGLYQISTQGRIKSFVSKKELILTPNISKGYYKLALTKNKKQKTFRIHQLMAFVFFGHLYNKDLKIIVDHIDNNQLNNNLSNLQLITNRENASKDRKNGTSKYVGVSMSLNGKWAANIQYNDRKINLGYYDSEVQASLAYQKALKQVNDKLDLNVIYPKKVKTSSYKGVYYSKERNRWIPVFNKKKLKSCKTEMEAKQVRDSYIESAHRLKYKGHWILIDPKINEKCLGEIRMALNLGCGHCANEDESPFNEPCLSCTFFNNFQPKE